MVGNVSLRHLNHTYNPDENCITTNCEQEQENALGDIFTVINIFLIYIKALYFEKEDEGAVWSYFFKQETDSFDVRKQIEGWKNHTDGLCYMFVNNDFTKLYGLNKMFSIDGKEYPEYHDNR